jgi:hypothetical protein
MTIPLPRRGQLDKENQAMSSDSTDIGDGFARSDLRTSIVDARCAVHPPAHRADGEGAERAAQPAALARRDAPNSSETLVNAAAQAAQPRSAAESAIALPPFEPEARNEMLVPLAGSGQDLLDHVVDARDATHPSRRIALTLRLAWVLITLSIIGLLAPYMPEGARELVSTVREGSSMHRSVPTRNEQANPDMQAPAVSSVPAAPNETAGTTSVGASATGGSLISQVDSAAAQAISAPSEASTAQPENGMVPAAISSLDSKREARSGPSDATAIKHAGTATVRALYPGFGDGREADVMPADITNKAEHHGQNATADRPSHCTNEIAALGLCTAASTAQAH